VAISTLLVANQLQCAIDLRLIEVLASAFRMQLTKLGRGGCFLSRCSATGALTGTAKRILRLTQTVLVEDELHLLLSELNATLRAEGHLHRHLLVPAAARLLHHRPRTLPFRL
jgi:hypothetical protein